MLLPLISWLTTAALLNLKKRNSKRQGARFYFAKHMLDVAWPFATVMTLFAATLLYINGWASNSAPLEQLMAIEIKLNRIKALVKALAVPPQYQISILLVLISLQFELTAIAVCKNLHRALDLGVRSGRTLLQWYDLLLKPLVLLVTFATSFSFFGAELGEPADQLRLRIGTLREGYAALHRDLHERLQTEVRRRALQEALDNLPTNYSNIIADAVRHQETAKLVVQIHRQLQRYGPPPTQLATVAARYTSEGVPHHAHDVMRRLAPSSSQQGLPTPAVPPESISSEAKRLSQQTLEHATQALPVERKRPMQFRPPLRQYLSDLSKESLAQLLNPEHSLLLKSWLDTYPLAGPLVDALRATMLDSLQQKIDSQAQKLAREALHRPVDGPRISQVAANLVRKVSAAQRNAIARQTEQEAAILQRGLAELTAVKVTSEQLLSIKVQNTQTAVGRLKDDLRSLWLRKTKMHPWAPSPATLMNIETLLLEIDKQPPLDQLALLQKAKRVLEVSSTPISRQIDELDSLARAYGVPGMAQRYNTWVNPSRPNLPLPNLDHGDLYHPNGVHTPHTPSPHAKPPPPKAKPKSRTWLKWLVRLVTHL